MLVNGSKAQKTSLVVDVSCLAYRSFYALPTLSHAGIQTAVGFGVLRTVMGLEQRFQSTRTIWCFDGTEHTNKRRELLDTYKKRDPTDPSKKEFINTLRTQVKKLYQWTLPAIGYQNVLCSDGYEADDVIASVCQSTSGGMIIVSSDDDLYQLLTDSVSIWLPHRKVVYTKSNFEEDNHISPEQWWKVKAIAGCVSDNVKGIRGVGVRTAVKYINGNLAVNSKARMAIESGSDVIALNEKLVRLPFAGTGIFALVDDQVTDDSRDLVLREMGMNTLLRKGRVYDRNSSRN